MAAPQANALRVAGVQVQFPEGIVPFPAQRAVVAAAVRAMTSGSNALLESRTWASQDSAGWAKLAHLHARSLPLPFRSHWHRKNASTAQCCTRLASTPAASYRTGKSSSQASSRGSNDSSSSSRASWRAKVQRPQTRSAAARVFCYPYPQPAAPSEQRTQAMPALSPVQHERISAQRRAARANGAGA